MAAPVREPTRGRSRGPARETMRRATRGPAMGPLLLALLTLMCGAAESVAQDALEQGQEVYERWCAACHGADGAGEGPAAAYMLPRPRDFTRGLYQIRSTMGGQIPTDDDIMRVINEGMPGTTMPGWENALSGDDREALVQYVKSFYPPFETMEVPEAIDFPSAPGVSQERIEEGRRFYEQIECYTCHGQAGRGDGESAPTLEDDWDHPIRAVDLTENWRFNGGGSVEDIYERLRTGLDGTPMAAFWDLVESEFMTDDQLWSLAHYVRSLAPDSEPRVREVIRAARVEPGQLPNGLDDEAWERIEPAYVPLVGQIIIKPRWFDPRVDGVWVEALHDEEEIVFRITWHDPSRSPDAAWEDWQAAVIENMEPEDDAPLEPGPRPDRLAVQFPVTIPEGMDRPFFLMGDARSPVYLWQWQSDGAGATEATAQGMTQIQPFEASGFVTSEASWEQGRWQLFLRRALQTDDPASRLQFETGVSIPVAFFAWDGDNGEEGTRGSISSWYYVHLEVETPITTYATPLLAFLITGGLGVVVVARAQRREARADAVRESGPEPDPSDGRTATQHPSQDSPQDSPQDDEHPAQPEPGEDLP